MHADIFVGRFVNDPRRWMLIALRQNQVYEWIDDRGQGEKNLSNRGRTDYRIPYTTLYVVSVKPMTAVSHMRYDTTKTVCLILSKYTILSLFGRFFRLSIDIGLINFSLCFGIVLITISNTLNNS